MNFGEIEDNINKLDFIDSCAVVKKNNPSGKELLCAYFTSKMECDIDKIKNHLIELLPNYMIPSYFLQMDKLPYTSNGKIDRKKLPDPKFENSDVVKPRNEIDSKLVEIFRNILGINTVSITDSFFEIGGDSLSAITLCATIKNDFSCEIFVKDIMENQTIQKLSDFIALNSTNIELVNIEHVKESEYYELSTAQQRIYLASIVAPDSILYNISAGTILDKFLDKEKIQVCINQLIQRHESLRTYFDVTDEKIVQKIEKNIDYKIQVSEEENFENLENIFKDFVKPFNLNMAPLFRIKYIEFTNGKSAILLDMHHIISDGSSLSIFINEFSKLYNGEQLSEINYTYKDWVYFENEEIKSWNLNEAEKYWLNKFSGEIPVLNLPTKAPRPAVQSFEGKKVYFSIDSEIVNLIKNLSTELNVTPYMIYLSCYFFSYGKYICKHSNNIIKILFISSMLVK